MTKDADFIALRALRAEGPPVIWIRIGNATRGFLVGRMAVALPAILAAINRGETVIEVTSA